VPDVPEMQKPVFAIKNAAKRWATTVNYDLLIYDDRLLIARGCPTATLLRSLARTHETHGQPGELGE
jgi:hypothetical protein